MSNANTFLTISGLIDKINIDGKYDIKKLRKHIKEERKLSGGKRKTDREIIMNIKIEKAVLDTNFFSRSWIDKQCKRTEKAINNKIEINRPITGKRISKRDRIINEYMNSATGLSEAQIRHAEASDEINKFNNR